MTRTVSSMTDFEKNAITIKRRKAPGGEPFWSIIELR